MAYSPCYPNKRNWANLPSESSPINETNLNAMDNAIYTLDGRVVDVSTRLDNDETAINNKVDKVSGKGLSTNDYTTAEKTKLAGIETGANKTVVDSALSGSSTNPVQNKVVKSAVDAKSTVSVTPVVTEGTVLANITIDGTTTAIKGSDIEVDDTPSATSENPLQNKAIYEMLNNLLPEETAEGNPIAISDASGLNAKACSVDLLPIQDLHGYDSPWAGGAGKNKLGTSLSNIKTANTSGTWTDNSYERNGITFTVNDDGTIKAVGTATSNAYLILPYEYSISAGTYTLSGCPSGGSQTKYEIYFDVDRSGTREQGTGKVLTLSAGYNLKLVIFVANGQSNVDLLFEPQLESGSTKTDFAPYENICPISGRTEVSIKRVGINQWDEDWETGTINANTGEPNPDNTRVRSKNFTRVKPNTEYYALPNIQVFGYNADKTFIGVTSSSVTGAVFTTQNNCYFVKFRTPNTYGGTYNNDLGINYPSTDTTYHAYQGQTYTETLGQTVYGGKVDFVSGKLTIDKAYVDFGNLTWTAQGNPNTFQSLINDFATPSNDLFCSAYPVTDYSISGGNMPDKSIKSYGNSSAKYIIVKDSSYSTTSEASTGLSGVQLCYPLATPIEVTLTAEQISLLKGNNVVSTDGDNINLKYSADIKAFIESQLQNS